MPHLAIAVWGCCDVVRPLRCCSWLWGSGCPDLTIVGLRYTLPGASDVLVYCVWRVALPHLPLGVQSQVRRHPIAVAMWTFVSGEGRCRLCGRSFKVGLPTALNRWNLLELPRGSGLAYSAHHIRTLVLVEEVGQAWRGSDSDAYAGLQPFGGG